MQFQCNKTKQHDKSDWHISDNAHQNAFETYIQYIQDEIVEKKRSALQISTYIWVIAIGTGTRYGYKELNRESESH